MTQIVIKDSWTKEVLVGWPAIAGRFGYTNPAKMSDDVLIRGMVIDRNPPDGGSACFAMVEIQPINRKKKSARNEQ